ncbi:2-oxo-4-hydroxy-4-carboxy-5-ureidoimidazoline decarboxylase [Erwiniaceae bacterium BAC15a-03b]|uniref:2-oxo-4-hydroxy-4-carboxy-5-ureidoimidazoline decarboxylase n=1 Tax=Winslowiella arboricola TaxID=2978220 RepID=A0A9J6PL42_9GAMM|nr:2-oxo-4-hydroxy-4-carboxy-5-ureidoimidazoline decarboxylase [Winslowiella arboricola]MCU5771527.1 2-oxo-4-hydroxy-4-carboxy-5-ureidoimidazoline decarboxylase [Winslowiella arboricola]MCU5776400.1 2-oxo-4-hydroxy-4-carboxy-5-ureidoimidazoline decarboxylase [Winslowiella arboricola]
MTLDQFNQLSDAEARNAIAHCVALPGWSSALAAARPYASVDTLLQHADALASQWAGDDLARALTAHPRIGERPVGASKEAALSRQEQSAVSDDHQPLKQALRSANQQYEQRFGQVFLIRAKGRSGEAMLAELQRRLTNDPQQEQQEALTQLREITLLRLQESFQ